MKVLSKIWHVFLMNKLFFILVKKDFQFIEHLDNSWVDLKVACAQNQDSNQKRSRGGMVWETTDKLDSKFCTEFGQCRENQYWGRKMGECSSVDNNQGACVFNWRETDFFKGSVAEPHTFIFAWLSAAEKLVKRDLHLMNPQETTPVTSSILGKSKWKEVRASLLKDLFQVQHRLWILSLSSP